MIKAPRPFVATSCLLATVTAIALVSAGCSHSTSGHTTKPPTPSTSSKAAGLGLPSGVRQVAAPTDVPNKAAARKNVTMTSCAKTGDGWSAAGTATNPDGASRTYTITVFFTTSGGTVIGHADTKATVAAGSKADWSTKAAFTPAETTRCILRGVA